MVAAICARLDGIPLAIELAAAQVRSMTVSDLADRLDHRFRLLRGPRRGGGLERHQTLRATIDWSYRLLDDDEALLFDRLSVFAGSFDFTAVGAVCGDDQFDRDDLFDVLTALCDRSMLSVERTGPHVRWRLLETLRQYGEERLDHRGETDLRRARHLAHFVTAAQDAHRAYAGTDSAAGAAAFEAAWDNLRAALGYAIASGDAARAAAIVEASIWYSFFGLNAEHADWVALVREITPRDPSMTGMAALWAALQGDQRSAATLGEASVVAAAFPREAEDLYGRMAIVYANFYSGRQSLLGDGARGVEAAAARSPDPFVRAVVACFSCLPAFYGDRASGLGALGRARDLAEQLGNGVALGFASYQAGNIHFEVGSYDVSLAEYERCVELASRHGATMLETWARTMLAARATDAGWPDAGRRFAETLRYLAANRVWSRIYGVLAALADRWASAGRIEPAANLIGFLEVHDPVGVVLVTTQRARAQAAVDEHPAASEWKARGARIERTVIIDYALSELGDIGPA